MSSSWWWWAPNDNRLRKPEENNVLGVVAPAVKQFVPSNIVLKYAMVEVCVRMRKISQCWLEADNVRVWVKQDRNDDQSDTGTLW